MHFILLLLGDPFGVYILDFGAACASPWLILGDFNNVQRYDEKCNGAEVTLNEIKDFVDCCWNAGLSDLRSIVCFYTWTENSQGSILQCEVRLIVLW